jgi:enolase
MKGVSRLQLSGLLHTESDIVIGIDCAASNFWNLAKTYYTIDGKQLGSDELLDYYCSLKPFLSNKRPIIRAINASVAIAMAKKTGI